MDRKYAWCVKSYNDYIWAAVPTRADAVSLACDTFDYDNRTRKSQWAYLKREYGLSVVRVEIIAQEYDELRAEWFTPEFREIESLKLSIAQLETRLRNVYRGSPSRTCPRCGLGTFPSHFDSGSYVTCIGDRCSWYDPEPVEDDLMGWCQYVRKLWKADQ